MTLPSPVVIWCLSFPVVEVVEIELSPIVALGEPDHLVRRRQHVPVHPAVAGLELRRDGFVEHVANGAGCRVGDAEHLVLVIARRRHEREVRAVRIPLDVGPVAATTGDVVAERRAMLVGGIWRRIVRGVSLDSR